jgi:hypothetical protein
MPNLHRGEIGAVLDGRPHTLVLTLGALAELEAAFGDSDMLALASRFRDGRLSARDCIRVLGAGLRAAGHEVSDLQVAAMQADGGAAGFVGIVAALLGATFGGGLEPARQAPAPEASARDAMAAPPPVLRTPRAEEPVRPVPFLGGS